MPDIIDTVMISINIMQERITRINLAVEPPDRCLARISTWDHRLDQTMQGSPHRRLSPVIDPQLIEDADHKNLVGEGN